MKLSKNYLLIGFLWLLIFAGCGRDVPGESGSVSLSSVIRENVGGIPGKTRLLGASEGLFFAYSMGNEFLVGRESDGRWYWSDVTRDTGMVRSWSGTVCGGEPYFLVEREDNELYLIKLGGSDLTMISVDDVRFSSAGVESSLVCDVDGVFHMAVYDPLLGALFYYKGKDGTFEREKLMESDENGRNPVIRVSDWGRVFIAYINGSTGNVGVASRNAGEEWTFEDTGVSGSDFSFEIAPDSGGDLSTVYPRLAVVNDTRDGLWYVEKVDSQWRSVFIDTGRYVSAPRLYVSIVQTGIVYQNSYWQDLMIAGYDGYRWHSGTFDSRGATGFVPSLAFYGGRLMLSYYSLSSDTILMTEVTLPWQ